MWNERTVEESESEETTGAGARPRMGRRTSARTVETFESMETAEEDE